MRYLDNLKLKNEAVSCYLEVKKKLFLFSPLFSRNLFTFLMTPWAGQMIMCVKKENYILDQCWDIDLSAVTCKALVSIFFQFISIVSQWTRWRDCSASCGESGTRGRNRTCFGENIGLNCDGTERKETERCNLIVCSGE